MELVKGASAIASELRYIPPSKRAGSICSGFGGRRDSSVRPVEEGAFGKEAVTAGCVSLVGGRFISLRALFFSTSHLPLTLWFRAMWHLTCQKNGISALGCGGNLESEAIRRHGRCCTSCVEPWPVVSVCGAPSKLMRPIREHRKKALLGLAGADEAPYPRDPAGTALKSWN